MKEAKEDLWDRLAATEKQVVLYGMGNGAEKLLAVLNDRDVKVSGIFSSEGFGKGKNFSGIPVTSLQELKAKYGAENLLALLAFGSSRPDVMETIERVAGEIELYAPDLPVFGDTLFDKTFYNDHLGELEHTRALLSDELSKSIFDEVVAYKRSGKLEHLTRAVSDPREDLLALVRPDELRTAIDLGAYDGDTVRELLDLRQSDAPLTIYAFEPDPKSFAKLELYAQSETRAKVLPVAACAWDKEETLAFDGSHNRNASVLSARSSVLSGRPAKSIGVHALRLDDLVKGNVIDYIKFDVEGSEQEAIAGAEETIARDLPTLAVSLYHRSEDLFSLPLLLKERFPAYDGFYLRRRAGFPAWDLTLYVTKKN